MLSEWIELGAYSNVLVHLRGHSQQEISAKVWANIMHNKSAEHWYIALTRGGERYDPIRDVWSCGVWVPAFP